MSNATKKEARVGESLSRKQSRDVRNKTYDFLMPYCLLDRTCKLQFLSDVHDCISLRRHRDILVKAMDIALREPQYERRVMELLGEIDQQLIKTYNYNARIKLAELVGFGDEMAQDCYDKIVEKIQDTRVESKRWTHLLSDAECLPDHLAFKLEAVVNDVAKKALLDKYPVCA